MSSYSSFPSSYYVVQVLRSIYKIGLEAYMSWTGMFEIQSNIILFFSLSKAVFHKISQLNLCVNGNIWMGLFYVHREACFTSYRWHKISLKFPSVHCSLLWVSFESSMHVVRGDQKSSTTHSWYMFYLSKYKLDWNQKAKKKVILSIVNVNHISDSCIHSFSRVSCNLVKSFCSDVWKSHQFFLRICFPSKIPRGRNPVVIDLGIKGATSFDK
jgi:hypothetical protein